MNGAEKKMRVISKKRLREYWEKNPQAEAPLSAWYDAIISRNWESIADLRQLSKDIDYVGGDRFVFDLLRNRFRLVVKIDFRSQIAFVRFIGTHKEYDRIDNISSI